MKTVLGIIMLSGACILAWCLPGFYETSIPFGWQILHNVTISIGALIAGEIWGFIK